MFDTDAIWTVAAEDGTTVTMAGPGVFAGAGTVLLLEEVTGFDSPNVRQNLADLPEQDGQAAGDFFYGARPITFKGKIVASTAASRNTTVLQLQRALRGLRGDVTIKSQAAGLEAMQTTARFDNLRLAPGFIKDFSISMICPDPVLYSQTLYSQSGTGSVATSGAAWPVAWPASWGGGTGATVTVSATNAGNYDSHPVLTITGPISNPWVRNAVTGDVLYIDNVTLAAGEYVVVDTSAKTVTKNDGSNLYSRIRFPDSSWLTMIPAANVFELRSGGSASTATLQVQWRNAVA